MPDQSNATVQPKGLAARAIGVLVSPRATYADIAARPRPFGAVVVVVLIIAAATFVFLSTPVGQRALLDQQLTVMESFGFNPTPEMVENMERSLGRAPYFSTVGQVVLIPLIMVVIAGILLAIFNAILGGDATFKQVFAVVAYSSFISVLAALFSFPLQYARETMSSPASLAVFFPMLDDTSFLGRLLGSIDLFRIWWIISLAIGLGVLYKRRTSPIAWSMLTAGGIIVAAIAAVRSVLSGA
jgi:hypothetical protein